jgi:hypothetical protein
LDGFVGFGLMEKGIEMKSKKSFMEFWWMEVD